MKTKLTIIKHLTILLGALATTSAFGQATGNNLQTNYIWIATGPNIDVGTATNWTPNGVPVPTNQQGTGGQSTDVGDIMDFEGQTAGPVFATSNGGAQAGSSVGGTTAGIYFHVGANQTSPVNFFTTVANSASSGIRFNSISIDAGSGGLTFGTGSTTNCLDTVWGTSNPSGQGLTNNSAVPAVINLDVRWRLGAGGAHTFSFAGTGDWHITNDIVNVNGSSTLVDKEGSGTMYWTAGHNSFWGTLTTINSPITIGGGVLVLNSGGLFPAATTINNSAALVYDAPASSQAGGAQTIVNPINGTGNLQVNNGTLTLAGGNTFSGSINLTGGEVIAGGTENVGVSGPFGQGGTISLNGGILGWSPANAFDYSSRFDTSAGQQYNFDTGGSSPTLATGLTSSGGTLTKIGGGTLTLAGANTYDGLTTVNVGELLVQGTQSSHGNIMVADGAVLGVVENGSQIQPGTLTVGSSAGAILEFNNVTNQTAATLTPANLVSSGTVTINVNSGLFFLIGETFPLLKWTSGTPPAVTLGFLAGAGGHLVTNLNNVEIDLVIDNPPYIWTGANSGTWDTTTINWVRNLIPSDWVNGNYALLDDTGTQPTVTLSGTITPTNTTVNNSSVTYAINNSAGNVLGGGGSLTKSGSGTLTLPGGANTYTGVTTAGGGVLAVNVFANGGSVSDIGAASSDATNLVLNGGTLQYTGSGASVNRLFSVGTSGGTIDNEGGAALVFANTGSLGMSGNGPRTLTLTGPNAFGDTIASAIVNHPAGTSLAKTGTGTWILTGTNTYASGTAVLGGILQVGALGSSGTLGSGNVSIASGASIDFQRTGTLTVPGAISGVGSVNIDSSGTVILPNNNSYSGGTTINTGTLQVGNGGATGSLNPNSAIDDESLLTFNTTGTFSYVGVISGGGNVIVTGGGKISATGGNTYSGWTLINANSTFNPCQGNVGALASSAVTNNGTLLLIRQDNGIFIYAGPISGSGKVVMDANNFNPGDATLTGNNTYTGGTFIGDNGLIVGDGSVNGSIIGNVEFTNSTQVPNDNARTLTFNRSDDITFPGNIIALFSTAQANLGVVVQNGTGQLTLTGNNTYGSGTTINAGSVQVGNGGATGSIGTGPVTLAGGTILFNRTGSLAVGTVSGTGSMTDIGTGTVTLTGSNSITGDVDLEAGTFGAAPDGAIGSLTMGGNLTIASGVTISAAVNRSLSPSNSVYTVGGSINYTGGGTLRLVNAGPLLQVGDKFTIFSQPVANLTIVSPGFTVQNNLGVDGSVTVTAASPLPTITSSVSGGQLNLSWPVIWTGAFLQGETNTLKVGLTNDWVNIPGTAAGNSYTTSINHSNGAVFFRLTQ